jgi:hypothetical protein
MPKQNEKTQKVYFGFISGYSHPKLLVHISQNNIQSQYNQRAMTKELKLKFQNV